MAGLFSPEQETDQVTDQALASLTLDSSPFLGLTSSNTPAGRAGLEWIPVNCLHYTQVSVHYDDKTSHRQNCHLTDV